MPRDGDSEGGISYASPSEERARERRETARDDASDVPRESYAPGGEAGESRVEGIETVLESL